jgi:Na+/H+ antiporter NhaA
MKYTVGQTSVGGIAAFTAFAAVAAMASCCVLPTALALVGLAGLGGSFFALGAEARTPIAILAGLAILGGWGMFARAQWRCRTQACERPSQVGFWLLITATALIGVAATWTPIIEPLALKEMLHWRR